MKHLYKFSLFLLALLLPATATAHDFEVDGIYYNINGNEATVTYSKYSGDVTIPATVTYGGTTYSVTSIDQQAFYLCSSLTSIDIPNSVTSIGNYAFYGCSALTSVTIPNSVTNIGGNAFYGTSWYNNQPNGLVYAGLVAYKYKGTMPSGTSITLRDGTLGIANSAFYGCSGLTNIDIPNSVTTIGSGAFYGTSWYNNQPDGLIYAGLVAYEYKGTMPSGTRITIKEGTLSITAGAFSDCTGLSSIDIPNSVTTIGESAFRDCSGLTSITIPNSVIFIGNYAFSPCSGLTSIEVETGNSKYDSRNNCNAIIETATNTLIAGCMNTVIPNSVTSIGDLAFYLCSGLTSITIPNSVTSIRFHAFHGCDGLTSITIPNSVTSIGEGAFDSCSGLTNIAIGNSVIEIGDGAFQWCTSLTSIDIPNSVTTIGGGAFWMCSSLTSITIPNSVTTIGGSAFSSCSGLTNIAIGNSVVEIGDEAFKQCTSLTSIDIPNSVTTIGQSAFRYCSGLTSATIGNSVTTIGENAFDGCSSLTQIHSLAMSPPTIYYYTFNGCYGASLYVPKQAVNAYKSANYWKNFTNILGFVDCVGEFEIEGILYRATNDGTATVIANEEVDNYYIGDVVIADTVSYVGNSYVVKYIDNNAFSDCYDLTSVVIPNSVETIGEQAFQGCTGLTSVTIGNGVTAIGARAFNYCNALASVKCIGTVPPVMANADCFSTAAYNRATLIVPRNYEATYAVADYWYKFAHIDGWGSAGRGDIDGDGEVSIRDVTRMIDAILTGEHEGVYFESADLNNNGRLDIGDVTTIIDMLLNGE